MQYTYCTLAHVHTSIDGTMPLTKLQYLRYVRLSSFGVVNIWNSNAILLEAVHERSRCSLRVTKQLRKRDHIYWYLPLQKTGAS